MSGHEPNMVYHQKIDYFRQNHKNLSVICDNRYFYDIPAMLLHNTNETDGQTYVITF